MNVSKDRWKVEAMTIRRSLVDELAKLQPHADILRLMSKGVDSGGPLGRQLSATCCGIVYVLLVTGLESDPREVKGRGA